MSIFYFLSFLNKLLRSKEMFTIFKVPVLSIPSAELFSCFYKHIHNDYHPFILIYTLFKSYIHFFGTIRVFSPFGIVNCEDICTTDTIYCCRWAIYTSKVLATRHINKKMTSMCHTVQAEYQMKTLECLKERNYRIIDELDSLQWIQQEASPAQYLCSR